MRGRLRAYVKLSTVGAAIGMEGFGVFLTHCRYDFLRLRVVGKAYLLGAASYPTFEEGVTRAHVAI
jgi:hypothetical protein